MKKKMYMIYCGDTYLTCFIDGNDIEYEVLQDGSDVRICINDHFYNYRTWIHYCSCYFIVKEV